MPHVGRVEHGKAARSGDRELPSGLGRDELATADAVRPGPAAQGRIGDEGYVALVETQVLLSVTMMASSASQTLEEKRAIVVSSYISP